MSWFNRDREMLMGMFSAWASGKNAKMKTGDGWKTITPDNLKVRTFDGEWVSIRDAIAAYDRKQEADGLSDPEEIEDTQGDAPEWTL